MDLDAEEFWVNFYASHDDMGREWYVDRSISLQWSARLLAPLLRGPSRRRVLHVGAGTSTLHLSIAAALRAARDRSAAVAPTTIVNLDFAPESVAALERHTAEVLPTPRSGAAAAVDAFEFVAADVRELGDVFGRASFAAAVDKGTLDSMLANAAVRSSNAHMALFELSQVLTPRGGRLVIFSLFGPLDRLRYLLDGEEVASAAAMCAGGGTAGSVPSIDAAAAEDAAARTFVACATAAEDGSDIDDGALSYTALGLADAGVSRRYGWRVWWRGLNIAPLEVGFSNETYLYVCERIAAEPEGTS